MNWEMNDVMTKIAAQILPDESSVPMCFDECVVGLTASFRHTITTSEIDRFVELSGDTSPMHLTDDAAIERGFDGRIPHGMLLGALASRLVGVHLPGPNGMLQSMKLNFVRPAPIGEELLLLGRIEAKSAATQTIVLKIRVTEVKTGLVIVRGAAQVGILSFEP